MLTSLTLTQQLMCLSLGLFIIEILFFLWVKKNIIHLQKPDPILDQLQQFFDQLNLFQVSVYIMCYSAALIAAKYFKPLFFIIFSIQGLSIICDIFIALKIKQLSQQNHE